MLILKEIFNDEVLKIKDEEKKKEMISVFKNIITQLKNKFGEIM